MHARRGSAEFLSGDGRAAGELPDPRAKRLVPSFRDHASSLNEFRMRSECDESQLSLFPNLNAPGIPPDLLGDVAFDDEDDPTTEFIRFELKRLEQSDRGALYRLEKASNVGSGYLSKLKNDDERKMHVGMTFIRKIAPALGCKDLGEFFFRVGQWWEETGRAMVKQYKHPETIDDPELRVAVEMAKGFSSPDVVMRVMAEFPDQIGKRDRWWWIDEIKREAKAEFERKAHEAGDERVDARHKRKLKQARENAPESTRNLAGEMPPAPASSAATGKLGAPKRRRVAK